MAASRRNNGGRVTGKAMAGGRVTPRPGLPASRLDDVARQIIEQLREDGRRPYAAIGQAVGLSEAAIRQRVQRLVDAGVMRITALTDPACLGHPRQALVGIIGDGDLEELADRVARLSEVDKVVITAGSFDLLAELACRDDDHLLTVLRQLRVLDGIRATEVFVYLKSARRQ